LGKRIPKAAAAQGIGTAGARMVLIGGGTFDARANLPHGHPWRLSHGGDVAAILRLAPRVRGCGAGASEAGARALARPGCPIACACARRVTDRYGRRKKKGKQRPTDVWTPPGGESKEKRCELGQAVLRSWSVLWAAVGLHGRR
jgi:hypothetical protein